MISIKQLMDLRLHSAEPHTDLMQSALELVHLLLDGMSAHLVWGRDSEVAEFQAALQRLSGRVYAAGSSLDLLSVGSETLEVMERYAGRTMQHLREQTEQLQSMVASLTQAVAEISGQSDKSLAALYTIERQMEQASELNDMRALNASLRDCLASLRTAAAEQRRGAQQTICQMREQIDRAERRTVPLRSVPRSGAPDSTLPGAGSEEPGGPGAETFVAIFKLRRSERIASRFGVSTRSQMLSLLGQRLKNLQRDPSDRLLRWKGDSFMLFLTASESVGDIRSRLHDCVSSVGQHYVEVGQKSALLSVAVDWMIFRQNQFPTLDSLFAEVDAFLVGKTQPDLTRSSIV